MSDYIDTRQAPNAHDTALAVLRPEIYTEVHDWLREMNPGLYHQNPGFRIALGKLAKRRDEVTAAPSAGMLDHATAAYYRDAAATLERLGGVHEKSARLLRSIAIDLDGGDQ
jgi:hypothetical protein